MQKFDVLGVLFPRRCPICHDVVEERGELACKICRVKLPYVREVTCQKCGKPLLSEAEEYCLDCKKKKHMFEKGKAPFVYDKIMKTSIARYKYSGRREYAAFYAEEILRKYAKDMLHWKAEVLIPIPLHRSRKRTRGFNQAELLAKELSKRSGIPMDSQALLRVKKTTAQKDLGDKDRFQNLRGAFAVKKGELPYKTVILVDDIFTTGSTIDEASRVLKENGVQKVYFLSICVGSSS